MKNCKFLLEVSVSCCNFDFNHIKPQKTLVHLCDHEVFLLEVFALYQANRRSHNVDLPVNNYGLREE